MNLKKIPLTIVLIILTGLAILGFTIFYFANLAIEKIEDFD